MKSAVDGGVGDGVAVAAAVGGDDDGAEDGFGDGWEGVSQMMVEVLTWLLLQNAWMLQ